MTTTPPEPVPHPWLPQPETAAWLQLDAGLDTTAELCRQAAASYCESQRPDLLRDVDGRQVFAADAAVSMAGLIATARLFSRRSTPAGLASFGEFGAAEVLRLDPDVARLLGTGRNAYPRIG